jgi:muramidase (phage lysozyme)
MAIALGASLLPLATPAVLASERVTVAAAASTATASSTEQVAADASSGPAEAPDAATVATLFRRLPLPPPPPRVFAMTPERRALLNTIRYAEGTWANGNDIGYWIMFGGGLMPSLDRHPDRVNRTARYASAAAGAYQFMPFTWDLVTRSLGLQRFGPQAFGPQVQDQGALFLIQRRGALALADQGVFTPQLAHKLAPEWASFPTLAGRSFYGQPVKRFHELKRFYEDNLASLRARMAPVAQETKPACEPATSLRCRLEALESVGPRTRS